MRNGQNNNKRMRNRNNNNNNNSNNNNNRRGQNPMTRVFESNGPDIKIRGTASHVAEKYVQLARDARSSACPVDNSLEVIRSRSSAAALLVKVTTMMRPGSSPKAGLTR